jgi:peptidoglycan/xylan/chitin deacetylase (PgdA/CDA1 family)
MKYAAINLNLDSLGEAYGFPDNYKDPSFFEIADRFMMIADKYDFRYTIFVIGKDLLKPENQNKVKEWASKGHEIGNHSWSHPLNLGAMKKSEIQEEVQKAHEIIKNTINIEPKGFIAPGWSTSRKLMEVLIAMNYLYDTSVFPSIVLYPFLLKMFLNHIGDRRLLKIFHRSDLLYFLYKKRHINRQKAGNGEIIEMPLPTNKYRIACWHTLAFMIDIKYFLMIMRSCLKDVQAFYYLVHPADLASQDDLDPKRKIHLERLSHPLQMKLELFEKAIKEILADGRKIVTLEELSKNCFS